MESLQDVIADAASRPRVVSSIVQLIDSEVSSRRGLSGAAIKTGYSVVKKLKGGRLIPDVVDGLLEEFVGAIEPLHAEYRGQDRHDGFDRFLTSDPARAVNGLLAVTDSRAQSTPNGVIRKTYQKLRPMAEKQVEASLPGVGRVVDEFCA